MAYKITDACNGLRSCAESCPSEAIRKARSTASTPSCASTAARAWTPAPQRQSSEA